MSTSADNEFDLEKLFLPAWAQESSSAKYAHYEGETERPEREGGHRGRRPMRREGGPDRRRDQGRPGGQSRGDRPRPQGGRGAFAGGQGRPERDRGRGRP